jgi:hypothetical protein
VARENKSERASNILFISENESAKVFKFEEKRGTEGAEIVFLRAVALLVCANIYKGGHGGIHFFLISLRLNNREKRSAQWEIRMSR